MRFAFFAVAILLIAPKLQAAQETVGQPAVSKTVMGQYEIPDAVITPGNLERIFNLSFATKTDGHGFGLHGVTDGAKEMVERLLVISEGVEQDATFGLELPATEKSRAGKAVGDEPT